MKQKDFSSIAITITERPKNELLLHDLDLLESFLSTYFNVIPLDSYDKDADQIISLVRPIVDRVNESNSSSTSSQLLFIYVGHGDLEDNHSVLTFKDSYLSVQDLAELLNRPNIQKYGTVISACKSTDFLRIPDILGPEKSLSIFAADDYQKTTGNQNHGGFNNSDLITKINDEILKSKFVDINLRELDLIYKQETAHRRKKGEAQAGAISGKANIYIRNPKYPIKLF